MPVPSYGATPLSKTFLVLRALQLVCFVAIIGITVNFLQEIISTSAQAPSEILGTLIVVSGTSINRDSPMLEHN